MKVKVAQSKAEQVVRNVDAWAQKEQHVKRKSS